MAVLGDGVGRDGTTGGAAGALAPAVEGVCADASSASTVGEDARLASSAAATVPRAARGRPLRGRSRTLGSGRPSLLSEWRQRRSRDRPAPLTLRRRGLTRERPSGFGFPS